jgi:radical SAM protein with 4Fe4S-binding SPASM domain
MTVTRRNLHEVFSAVGEAFLAGAGELLLNRFQPGGRGLQHWRDLILDRPGTQRMLDEAEAALQASSRPGHVGTELPRCGFDAGQLAKLRVGTRCGAAHQFFVVDPSGFVRVCNHSPRRLLHWRKMDRLWNEPYWRRCALHQHVSAACDGCDSSHVCDGGCPESTRILSGEEKWDPLVVGERTTRQIHLPPKAEMTTPSLVEDHP